MDGFQKYGAVWKWLLVVGVKEGDWLKAHGNFEGYGNGGYVTAFVKSHETIHLKGWI